MLSRVSLFTRLLVYIKTEKIYREYLKEDELTIIENLDLGDREQKYVHLKETQIYAKIVNEELDKVMDIFND